MNTTETPIDNSINTLEQYMLPSQKANLVKILEMGENWKKEGAAQKAECAIEWSIYRARRRNLKSLYAAREKEHEEELHNVGYYNW